MVDAFIDIRELDANTLRDISVKSGVIWPEDDDRESRLFRFRVRRIATEAYRRGVADGQKINAAVAVMFGEQAPMNDAASAAPSDDQILTLWHRQPFVVAFARDVLAKWGQPTPPAVVEPLTDEQIVGVMHSIPINAAPSHHSAFARAIEHQHGIKGGQHDTE